jgi:NADH-quinone oxidoreductase subunit L
MPVQILTWLIPLPPLLAFGLIGIFLFRKRALSHWTALVAVGISWLASMVVFVWSLMQPHLAAKPLASAISWLPMGKEWLKIGVQVDPLTAISLFFVAWTVLMIFIYSVGYHNYGNPKGEHDKPGFPPHGTVQRVKRGERKKVMSIEPMYARFFAFICLFAFGMYTLVVSDNLLTLYIGWEIMGLCSYLLIGFWYGKESARDAAVKAFITTRVGDMFMLIGLVALYQITGSLNYQVIFSAEKLQVLSQISPILGLSWSGLIGLLLFIGTVGKSAQFPLHVWLPDAMEGPTPVSAMIHAATMVSAGIYLVVRFFPLISNGWAPGEPVNTTMMVMMVIGSFTALFAATIALTQNDIKRVLAFSTISQLGYMIAALGVGAYVAAGFHLVTHAFFKALLFLGSGSVIHGMENGVFHTEQHVDTQDMFNMGGLRKKMPTTFWTFLIGGLALSGFPVLTAGFWSKDEILTGAFNSGYMVVFVVLGLAALLTAFYTMRQITLTFFGEPRTPAASHAHESSKIMIIPLIVLAVFSITAGWSGIPKEFPLLGGLIPDWFKGFLGSMIPVLEEVKVASHSFIPLLTSLTVSLLGLLIGWLVYRNVKAGEVDPLKRTLGPIYTLLKNKYYVDEFYQKVFIKPAYWLAETFTYAWMDKKIIDGILDAVGRFGLWLGTLLRERFDTPVINRFIGDGIANSTRLTGTGLRPIQTGRVQEYMVIALVVVAIAGIVVYFFV